MKTIGFFKNIFNLHGKVVRWAVVEEISSNITDYKPGLFIKGSRVYVDLYARRFYSTVKLDFLERKVYPARRVRAEGGAIVLEAKDAPDKYVILPQTFINDIFGTTIYGEWMEGRLIL